MSQIAKPKLPKIRPANSARGYSFRAPIMRYPAIDPCLVSIPFCSLVFP